MKNKIFWVKKLYDYIEKFRSNSNKPDCLVGLSGENSVGLHLLKTKYGLNPVAYI